VSQTLAHARSTRQYVCSIAGVLRIRTRIGAHTYRLYTRVWQGTAPFWVLFVKVGSGARAGSVGRPGHTRFLRHGMAKFSKNGGARSELFARTSPSGRGA
jgi:hypothetical protein